MRDVEDEDEDEDEIASDLNPDEGQSYFKFVHSELLSYLCGLHRTR